MVRLRKHMVFISRRIREKTARSFALRWLLAAAVSVALLPCQGAAASPAELVEPNQAFELTEEEVLFINSLQPLRVMVDDNFVPLSTYDEKQNAYRGISVDLFQHIAGRMGLQYKFLRDPKLTWADKEELLKSGKIDLLMPVSFTPPRALAGIFTAGFYDSYYGAIARNSQPIHIKNSYDLASYRLGVTRASAILSFIQPFVPAANIVTFDSQEAMYQAVRKGDIDVALQNENVFREDRFNLGFIDLQVFHTLVESPRNYSYYLSKTEGFDRLAAIIDRYLAGIDVNRLITYYDSREDELIQRYTEEKNQKNMLLLGIAGLLTLLAILTVSFLYHRRLAAQLKASIEQTQLQREALQKSENNLKRAMEIARLGDWEYDVDSDLFTFTDQFYALLHTTAEAAGGYTMSSKHYAQTFLHPDEMYMVGVETEKALTTTDANYSRQLEHRIICADGEIRTIIVHIRIVKDQNGRTVKSYGANQDVTELRRVENENEQLQKQLQQAQKMEAIGTLAGGIAHDFNNILGAILGYAEMAKDGSPEGSMVASDIDQVIKASTRAKDLVKQILDFSRHSNTGRIPVQPAVIILEAIKMLRSSLPATIAIHHDIDREVGFIKADPTQIHQILMNLCTNAFHAMEETGGTLTISLRKRSLEEGDLPGESHIPPGDFLEMSVEDTGAGISAELKEKIFEPYFTTKEVGKGTGMGLAIIHGIVTGYGGFVTCQSQPGEGSIFRVFLPVTAEAELQGSALPEPAKPGSEHILFVDDEEALAKMGKIMFERLGYRVTMRTSSIEALATFAGDPDSFDLVITDQTMPGMIGSTLARKILQIKPGMPIILCTGYSNQISEEKAGSFGIKGFAMKPLAKQEIALLIRKALDER
ncbi:MAG: transporter substrate-binding domain-containing protein [Desulforhopalus sp.]|nr:transporter substrate-binding domain-containing protein [Desulforhopalus sp.]